MASLQTGQRGRSISANTIMASSTFIKHTGGSVNLWPLLLGILLQSVLVSGQNNTTMPDNTTTTVMTVTMPMTMVSTVTTDSTSQSSSMSTGGTTSVTNTTSNNQTSMTSSASTGSSAPATTNSTAVPTTMITSNTTMSTSAVTTSNSMTTSGNTAMPPGDMFYCPSFTCNYSDCYTMYNTWNATWCPADCYCQLMRQMDQCYTVNCTMSCAVSCNSSSQINCSVDCCNSTDCLNSSFASMMMTTSTATVTTTTTMTTTTTKPVTTMATTSSSTTPMKGNRCHKGTCTGPTCYKVFNDMQICSASQPHCQLVKETVPLNLPETKWTAGCTTNCSSNAQCSDTTKPPCNLECCNATMTSCLMLNGTLNFPSSATRVLHLSTELLISVLCLLSITLLL